MGEAGSTHSDSAASLVSLAMTFQTHRLFLSSSWTYWVCPHPFVLAVYLLERSFFRSSHSWFPFLFFILFKQHVLREAFSDQPFCSPLMHPQLSLTPLPPLPFLLSHLKASYGLAFVFIVGGGSLEHNLHEHRPFVQAAVTPAPTTVVCTKYRWSEWTHAFAVLSRVVPKVVLYSLRLKLLNR